MNRSVSHLVTIATEYEVGLYKTAAIGISSTYSYMMNSLILALLVVVATVAVSAAPEPTLESECVGRVPNNGFVNTNPCRHCEFDARFSKRAMCR